MMGKSFFLKKKTLNMDCASFSSLKNSITIYDTSKPFTEFLVCECKRASIFDLMVLVDLNSV
jgi:hypothetical protein